MVYYTIVVNLVARTVPDETEGYNLELFNSSSLKIINEVSDNK